MLIIYQNESTYYYLKSWCFSNKTIEFFLMWLTYVFLLQFQCKCFFLPWLWQGLRRILSLSSCKIHRIGSFHFTYGFLGSPLFEQCTCLNKSWSESGCCGRWCHWYCLSHRRTLVGITSPRCQSPINWASSFGSGFS